MEPTSVKEETLMEEVKEELNCSVSYCVVRLQCFLIILCTVICLTLRVYFDNAITKQYVHVHTHTFSILITFTLIVL